MRELMQLVTSRLGLRPLPSWPAEMRATLDSLRDRWRLRADADVVNRLMTSESALVEFAGRLTINESFFFRHPGHFKFVVRNIVSRITSGLGRKARLLSAGCACGQEPYSLAIALFEVLGPKASEQIEIVAIDISGAAIAQAQAGVYSAWSVRSMSETDVRRWFSDLGNGGLKLRPEIRALVTFEQSPVQTGLARWPPASFDYIFFRNVAIYFGDQAVSAIYRAFHSLLGRDGFLMIAPGDPHPDTKLYRWLTEETDTIYALASKASSEHSTCDRACVVTDTPTVSDATSLSSVRSTNKLEFQLRFASVLRAADCGQYEAAIELVDRVVSDDGVDATTLMVRGQLYLAMGHAERSLVDFAQAVSLAPDEPLVRFWYAVALQRSGARNRALAHTRVITALLDRLAPGAMAFDGSTTVADLRLAVEHLRANEL